MKVVTGPEETSPPAAEPALSIEERAENVLSSWAIFYRILGGVVVVVSCLGIFAFAAFGYLAGSSAPADRKALESLAIQFGFGIPALVASIFLIAAHLNIVVGISKNLREANEHLRKLAEKEPS